METNAELFDLSGLELVKKKYYNADNVAELVEKARLANAALQEENRRLCSELEELRAQKNQISDTLMSARDIARQIIDDARAQAEETARLAQTQAEETVKAAEKKAELILSGARSKAADADLNQVQDYALRCVEDCVDALRRQHMDAIELINSKWQSFLSGLILPEERQAAAPKAEELPAVPEFSFKPVAVDFAPMPKMEEAKPFSFDEPAVDWMAVTDVKLPEYEPNYDDIDADTFFSAGFFTEQIGNDVFAELKGMIDSIDQIKEDEEK